MKKSKNNIFEILKTIFGIKNNFIFLKTRNIKENLKKSFKIIFAYILLKFNIYFIKLSCNLTNYLKIKPIINLLILKNIDFRKYIFYKIPTISINSEFKNAVYNIIGNFNNKNLFNIMIFNIFCKIIKIKLINKEKELDKKKRKYFFKNRKYKKF